MNAYALLVAIHVLCGSVALTTYWIAAAMKKGTQLHRRVGQLYLWAMLGVVLSGAPLVVAALRQDRPVAAAFLAFLLLLVTTSCWSAWRAVRDRRDRKAYFGRIYWTLAAAVTVAGAAMIALGMQVDALLLMVFGGVGVSAGIGAVFAARRAPGDPKWWLREHYSAMIGNGVATHIAFIGIGLRNAVPGIDPAMHQAVAWFGPLAVSVVAAWWLNRRYGRPVASGRLVQEGAGGPA